MLSPLPSSSSLILAIGFVGPAGFGADVTVLGFAGGFYPIFGGGFLTTGLSTDISIASSLTTLGSGLEATTG